MAREVGKSARMVAAARAMARETQQDLAAKLTEMSGHEWTRNQIGGIENGHRKLAVDELHLFAKAQGVPVSWYIEGPDIGGGDTGAARGHHIRDVNAVTTRGDNLVTASAAA